jgi:hypothetical protein
MKLDEAGQARAEAVEIGRVARSVDGGIGAAVERTGEPDHVDAFALAVDVVIAPRRLDRALDRFGAGVAEEHHRQRCAGQAVGQFFLPRNAEDVGDVPQLVGLRLQRGDQRRMAVAQTIGGDARHAIEEHAAVARVQAHAFARSTSIGARL